MLLIGAFTYVLLGSACAQSSQKPWSLSDGSSSKGTVFTPALKARIEDILKNNTIPGYSVAVVHPGSDVDVGYATWGNQTEEGDAVTPDTLFYLGSCSKAFLTTSMGLLIDDFAHGRNNTALPAGVRELAWNTKMKDLLPGDWALMDKWATEKASLRDALSHVSGLPRHDLSYSRDDTPVDVARRMQYLRPAYELREKWHYNNQMYMLTQQIISLYSGIPYPDFVAQRIFAPLNMSSTTFSPSRANATGRFTQSWTPSGRRIPSWFSDAEMILLAGAGGVISSGTDMAQWVRLLLGTYGHDSGLPKAAYEVPMQPSALRDVPFGTGIQSYGMGWGQLTLSGHPVVLHSGGLPGVSTLVTLFPQDGVGIVQFANADDKASANLDIMRAIANVALGAQLTQSADLTAHAVGRVDQMAGLEVPITTATLADAGPRLALEALAGTYADPGYGGFTLCAPSTTSGHCTGVLAAFDAVDAAKPKNATNTNDTLYAAWPRVWSNYVRLVRADDKANTFAFVPTTLFPQGYGRDATPFETPTEDPGAPAPPRVEFLVTANGHVQGFGVFGLVGDSDITERERLGVTVKERAEVWFERVI